MKKKFLTLFFVCFSLTAVAQGVPENMFTFLGIPIDGSEQAMKAQLKQKGFKENIGLDYLTGQFNGEPVNVYVHTNHQIVDRVFVAFQPTTEYEIRRKYNHLLAQFQNNGKYLDWWWDNEEIPINEDISYEISINHKRYEAIFGYVNPDMVTGQGIIDNFTAAISTLVSEENVAQFLPIFEFIAEQENEELIVANLQEQVQTGRLDEESVLVVLQAMQSAWKSYVTGHVWFMIHEYYGEYYIGLYYDNLANRPNGEDL